MDEDDKKSGGKGPRRAPSGRGKPQATGHTTSGERQFAPKRLSDDKPRFPKQDRKPGGAPKRESRDGPRPERATDGERKPFRDKPAFSGEKRGFAGKPRAEGAERPRTFSKGPRP